MSKLWFASSMRPYAEDEPAYYDAKDYDWATDFEKHWPEIKQELGKLVEEKDKEFQPATLLYEQLNPKGHWSNLQFFYWNLKSQMGDLKKCPVLYSLFRKYPSIVSAGLSRLEANSVIPEHRGDTNAT